MKLLIFLSSITLIWAGVKRYAGSVFSCDEQYYTVYPRDYKMNCTNEILIDSINKYRCNDPGCENGAWQVGAEKLSNVHFLVCCKPLCDTFDCEGAERYNPFAQDYDVTKDFGKTWIPWLRALPLCPETRTRACYPELSQYPETRCPTDVNLEKFYQEHIYCPSSTCQGKMVLDRRTNAWNCEDSSCTGPYQKMVYSSEYKSWVCHSPDCELEKMVYSPIRKRWLCSKDSSYCQQAQNQCAWDI